MIQSNQPRPTSTLQVVPTRTGVFNLLSRAASVLALALLAQGAGLSLAHAQTPSSPVTVTQVELTGRMSPATHDLLAERLAQQKGRPYGVEQARQLAEQLTRQLRDQGYPVALVVLSDADAQRLGAGVLRLHVFEGEVGKVNVLSNTSRVATPRIQRTVEQALCGAADLPCVITQAGIERAKLLLDDLPGLSPGPFELGQQGVGLGQTALGVHAHAPAQAQYSGSVTADNYGAHVSGANRLGVLLNADNLLGEGDLWRVGLNTTNKDQNTGFIDGYMPIGYQGLRLHSNLTRSAYSVSQTSTSGVVNRVEMGLNFPLVRGFAQNWQLSADGFYGETHQSVTGQPASQPSKQMGMRWGVGSDAGERSKQNWGDFWSAGVQVTAARNSQEGSANKALDQGTYAKLLVNASARLLFDDGLFALGSARLQKASRNLVGGEQMVIGGAGGVRAYGPTAGLVTEGLYLSTELRQSFALETGRISAGVWLDALSGWVVRNPYTDWAVNGTGYSLASNHRYMAGWGIGVDYSTANQLTTNLTLGRKLSGAQTAVPGPKGTTGNVVLLSLTQGF